MVMGNLGFTRWFSESFGTVSSPVAWIFLVGRERMIRMMVPPGDQTVWGLIKRSSLHTWGSLGIGLFLPYKKIISENLLLLKSLNLTLSWQIPAETQRSHSTLEPLMKGSVRNS